MGIVPNTVMPMSTASIPRVSTCTSSRSKTRMEIRFSIVPTESLEQFYTCQHLRHGDTVIDVGAYEGMYTFLSAALVGPSGKVVAIEPEAKARAKFLGNLARYPFQQVQVLPCAAFSSSGDRPFYLSQEIGRAHV